MFQSNFSYIHLCICITSIAWYFLGGLFYLRTHSSSDCALSVGVVNRMSHGKHSVCTFCVLYSPRGQGEHESAMYSVPLGHISDDVTKHWHISDDVTKQWHISETLDKIP